MLKTKKNITISLTFITLFSFVFFCPFVFRAEAQNIGSLKDKVTAGFSFKKDLKPGDTDPDVKELQRVLNADTSTLVALYGDGSPGQEITNFNEDTKKAVIKFQNKYKDTILTPNGLAVGDGLVNKLTRTKLNLLIGVINTYDSVGTVQGVPTTGVTSKTEDAISFANWDTFVSNLSFGSSGDEVSALQDILVSKGFLVMKKTMNKGDFDIYTLEALIKYQIAKGISPVSGKVDQPTRVALNAEPRPTRKKATSTVNTCQFVEVLISINVIPQKKANDARWAFNCPVDSLFF